MNKIFSVKRWMRGFAVLAFGLFTSISASAFKGSDPKTGQSYYLFNVYQAKFLADGSVLNNAKPVAFAIGANSSVKIGDATWTLSKKKDGCYQLKNGSTFFAFEDKVADPESPNDENRALYLGGGVTCQPSVNDTDRSYWQLISEEEYAEWQAKKKFTVASLNVDGMPKSISLAGIDINLNPDAREEEGARIIGQRLLESGFDVVGVSENFNYHEALLEVAANGGEGSHYAAMTHRGILSVGSANLLNFVTQSPLFDTDGLGLYYRMEGDTKVVEPSNESWARWDKHNGYTDQGADGLIRKGYRYYLITLADGTEIDLYTMHMDADDGQADREARASQLTQLVKAIKATDNKRPIVIIGDSNTRYTRDNVKGLLIDAINADPRFTIRDPWIMFGRDNKYPRYGSSAIMASTNGYLAGEVVDKIWFINNKESNIRLEAETYHQDLAFVDEAGSPLCDHKPCVVTFSYHEYDPEIDDVPVIETSDEAYYFRNRETGRYLMDGGWWSTHAVVGNYARMAMFLEKLPNGKYDITSQFGHLTDAAYVDNNNPDEYIGEWELIEKDGYYVFSYNQGGQKKALSADDPTYFNNNPLYRYVTTAPLNANDKLQQWEMVTESMLKAEMEHASAKNPVNVTYYIKSANFDRNDWNDHGKWTFDKKGNGSRVTDQGIGGADNDAFCNYNRGVKTTSTRTFGITNSNNQWDCYQALNVPAGYYVVTNQGFEKDTENTYLYAWSNPEGEYLEQRVLLSRYDRADFGSGDTQINAAIAFNANKYNNALPVVKVGEDGVLVVGVKKIENNSTAGWMVFDNFQLYYLGTDAPEGEYDYDVIASIKGAELNADETVWNVTGTWRLVDMPELESKLNANPALLVDAAEATFVGRPSIPTSAEVPNMMIKVNKASDVANTQNVIDAEGNCINFVVTDKADFASQVDFAAQSVNYVRTNTQGLNTVCVPFELKVSDFPETCTVYAYTGTNADKVNFKEVAGDEVIAAGTPILVVDETEKTGAEAKWEMNIRGARNVVAAVSGNADESQEVGANGSFLKRDLGTGYYKLNSAGTEFVKSATVSTVTPFRFYLYEGVNAAKSFGIALENGEVTSIEEFINDPQTNVEATFDLNGRKVLNVSRPGIFIKGGKKVMVK